MGKTVTSESVLEALESLPHSRQKKTVVVLDNAPIHRSRKATEGFRRLAERGLKVLFLPSYSPDLNRVEEEFGVIKYHHMPYRTYFSQFHLWTAVTEAFTERAHELDSQNPI